MCIMCSVNFVCVLFSGATVPCTTLEKVTTIVEQGIRQTNHQQSGDVSSIKGPSWLEVCNETLAIPQMNEGKVPGVEINQHFRHVICW